MATTITDATLTVTLTETITLNGSSQGSKNTFTVSSVDEIFKRIVSCAASQTTTLIVFNDNAYGVDSAVDVQDSKYIRITNKDDTNSVELAVIGSATLYQVKLDAGQSHILGSADDLVLAEADTSPSFGTMTDLSSIKCNPGVNAVEVELFVASI